MWAHPNRLRIDWQIVQMATILNPSYLPPMKNTLIFGFVLFLVVGAVLSFRLLSGEQLQGSFGSVAPDTLTMSLRSSPVSGSVVGGSDEVDFTGITLDCTVSLGCTVTDLTLQGFLDDEGDHNDWDTAQDASDYSDSLSTLVDSVWLEDSTGNAVSDVEAVNSSTYKVTFDSIDLTMANGDSMDLVVVGNLSSDVYWDDNSEEFAFGINSTSDLVVEDRDGNSFVPTGTVNAGTPTVYQSTLPNGDLTVSVDSTTPAAASVTNGTSDQLASVFRFQASNEAFLVSSLYVNNSQTGVTAAKLGDNDNNVSVVTLSYTDEDGAVQEERGALVNGTAQFDGLELYIPKDDTALLSVYVDLKTTADGATVGEKVKLNLGFGNFEAVGNTSGATLKMKDIDFNIPSTADFDFGKISYTAGAGKFAVDGAQNLSTKTLGSSAPLTVDNDVADNSNKLPVGSIVCVDDNNNGVCKTEDLYVVTAWPSTTAGTEDAVTLTLIDDAGDGSYDDSDDLLYALPGGGFLAQVKAITVN